MFDLLKSQFLAFEFQIAIVFGERDGVSGIIGAFGRRLMAKERQAPWSLRGRGSEGKWRDAAGEAGEQHLRVGAGAGVPGWEGASSIQGPQRHVPLLGDVGRPISTRESTCRPGAWSAVPSKGTTAILGAPPSWPHQPSLTLPKASPLHTGTLGLRASLTNFVGYPNIQLASKMIIIKTHWDIPKSQLV